MPKDFAMFREMKYNKPERFEAVKRMVLNREKALGFGEKLKAGEVSTVVRNVKQQEHVRGTKKWRHMECEFEMLTYANKSDVDDTDIMVALVRHKDGSGKLLAEEDIKEVS